MSKERKRRRTATDEPKSNAPPRRVATLFDAVAGRATYESILSQANQSSKYRDTQSNSRQAIPPEEVLFRRRGAPIRYEETDVYFANDRLVNPEDLPDSDLVKYLHAYASSFYQHAPLDSGKIDYQSLDETALLALGILLEEAAREHLGDSGDLALVEDERNDLLFQASQRRYWNGERWARSVVYKKPGRTRNDSSHKLAEPSAPEDLESAS